MHLSLVCIITLSCIRDLCYTQSQALHGASGLLWGRWKGECLAQLAFTFLLPHSLQMLFILLNKSQDVKHLYKVEFTVIFHSSRTAILVKPTLEAKYSY